MFSLKALWPEWSQRALERGSGWRRPLTLYGWLELEERSLRVFQLWGQHKRERHNSWTLTTFFHPTGQHGGFGSPGGGMSRGRGRRDNELIGQTVRISQGPYKGEPLSAGRQGLCWGAHPPDCLTPSRLHWCGEGCHGVHSPSGAALNLPDYLCRPPAAHHGVCLGLGKTSVGLMAEPREERGHARNPTHSTVLCPQ